MRNITKKQDELEWHPIEELQKVDRDYSGWGSDLDILKVKGENGKIFFCHTKRKSKKHPEKFSTRFGCFVSADYGEFGGTLKLPEGGNLSGNFCDVFDFGESVYAVESLGHMMGSFGLLEFTGASEYKEIYHTKGIFDGSWDFTESLNMNACVKMEDAVWFLIGGETIEHREGEERGEIKSCARLLKLTEDGLEEAVSCEERFSYVEDMVIVDEAAYISLDKMVVKLDIETGECRYWTTLSKEECENFADKYGLGRA